MDDLSITDSRLLQALEQLRLVNRFLGGYSATMSILGPYLRVRAGQKVRILDVGTGIADFPEYLVRWASRQPEAPDLEIVAADINPATVGYAQAALDRRLSPSHRSRISVVCADVLSMPFEAASFDIVMAAMFLHHFPDEAAIRVLSVMAHLAGDGIIVNDLSRHPLAFYGIKMLTRILPAAEMVRNDAPLSVLRGFRRDELAQLAHAAGLEKATVTGRRAFRWVLNTVGP